MKKQQITFFDEATIDKILIQAGSNFDDEENLIKWIIQTKNQAILKLRPTSISDLEGFNETKTGEGLDLFSDLKEAESEDNENINKYAVIIIDLTFFEIEKPKVLETIVSKLSQNSQNFFLYSTKDSFKVNIDFKKTLKALNISLVNLKKLDSELGLKIAIQYRNLKQIMVKEASLQKIVETSFSYFEILDKLDFLELCGNISDGLENIIPESEPQLFFLGFDPEKPNAEKWLKYTKSDEYQLALSLMLTKLNKTHNISKMNIWKKKIIELDKTFKSGTNLELDNLFKYFLWEYKNQV
jgi:hypothetical protein